ncbi:MAG: dephospho-CoA kinase [Candidatus Tectomicrobia bacterium]|nr:dephospho-CoA kinase [Candidatus Tectomicrobia bacterium]
MLVVGLTGGVASGKSTVSAMLLRPGAHLIDADLIAREIVAPGMPALAAIRARFGPEVLRPDGSLDRARLGHLVFTDAAQREALNRLTHPYILAAENERIATIRATHPTSIVLLDAALLIEARAYQRVERLIVVWVDHATQVQRLMVRDGLGAAAAEQRIAAQMPLNEKLAYADYIIDNRGDRAATQAQVEQIWTLLERERDARREV